LCNCRATKFKLNLQYLPVIKGFNTPFHRSHSRYWLPCGFSIIALVISGEEGRRRDCDYLVKRFGKAVCSIFTMPIEIILRPQVVLHGFRIWRRMIHPGLEPHSEYEGPALPFVNLIPGSGSFWLTRIVIEPLFVFIGSTILAGLQIFQPGLVTYLHLAALLLAMKNFIGWYRMWEYIRKLMDARVVGPIVAKLLDNKTTESELATIHLAGLPNNIAADLRQAAASPIAWAFSESFLVCQGYCSRLKASVSSINNARNSTETPSGRVAKYDHSVCPSLSLNSIERKPV
jgi:hypothetical protein